MEGVERYKVRLLPHNPQWEEEFLKTKEELMEYWNSNVADIQHVGSTAIKSICAKPILDIAVQLKAISNLNIEALTDRGYDYCGPQHGNKNYHLFVLRGKDGVSLRHIHCYDYTEKEFNLLVGFCKYLNENPEQAIQYENLKKKLVKKFPCDRVAYTAGKEAFIKSIYDRL